MPSANFFLSLFYFTLFFLKKNIVEILQRTSKRVNLNKILYYLPGPVYFPPWGKGNKLLSVGVFLQPIGEIHGHYFEFMYDKFVYLLIFNPSVSDQSVALSSVLTKTTYSELLFGIKLSPFEYGRLFPLHS